MKDNKFLTETKVTYRQRRQGKTVPNEKGSGDLPSCRREGLKLVGKGKRYTKAGDAVMWRLKGCPKYGGDVFTDYDMNGWYEQCLQCGYLHDLRTILEVK